jgi:hypothetical protein
MEGMRVIPCPDNADGCKYAPNCHTSVHHIYPRRTVESRLERDYSEDPRNKIRACRFIHDLLDTFPEPEFPPPEQMRRFLGRKALE